MIGVAVLGLGRIGPRHADVVRSTKGAALKAVAEVDDKKRTSFLAAHEEVPAHKDYRDVLARKDVQAVVVCLPHWLHEQACVDAANAGKHVFVEKPLANTVAECDRIIEAARKNRVLLMPAHTQRYYPVVRRTKELLDARAVGDPIMAVDVWYKPLEPQARPAWMLDRQKGGGMMLMDGVHMIDRLLWLFGPDVHSVKAMVGNPVYPEYSADDTAMGLLRWRSGLVATISRIAFRTGVTEYGADLFCTRGQLRFRIAYGQRGQTGVWIGQDEQWRPVEFPTWDPLERQFREFIDAVSREAESPIAPEHGRQVIQIMEAMERSSATGREVLLLERG